MTHCMSIVSQVLVAHALQHVEFYSVGREKFAVNTLSHLHGCGWTTNIKFAKFNLHIRLLTPGTQPARTSILKYFVIVRYTAWLLTCHLLLSRLPLTAEIKIMKYSHHISNHESTKISTSKRSRPTVVPDLKQGG